MSNTTNLNSNLSIIDGVKIWVDENGVTHFKPIEDIKKDDIIDEHNSSIQSLKDWYDDLPIKPIIKLHDTADPTGERIKDFNDIEAGSDGHDAAVIGLKFEF